jgi:hypothetical protein
MDRISARVRRRIERDFPRPDSAAEVCRLVAGASESERIQAAIVLAAAGDLVEIRRQAQLATVDWRDVLMNGGLGHLGWAERLDAALGPAS